MHICSNNSAALPSFLKKYRQNSLPGLAEEVTIPSIGIGAGGGVDGQVLVMHDMLGINKDFSPRFLRRYANLHTIITDAVKQYISDVKEQDFPNESEQY